MYSRLAVVLVAFAMVGPAQAEEEPPSKLFIPLAGVHRAGVGTASRFFPLPVKTAGIFTPHAMNIPAADDDIPKPHDGPAETMTKEQAQQILSIFGGQ